MIPDEGRQPQHSNRSHTVAHGTCCVSADERPTHGFAEEWARAATAPESASTDETRKPRAFHVGLMRRTGATLESKSACVIGLSSDGGVFNPTSERFGGVDCPGVYICAFPVA
jgi:hypothetical protein